MHRQASPAISTKRSCRAARRPGSVSTRVRVERGQDVGVRRSVAPIRRDVVAGVGDPGGGAVSRRRREGKPSRDRARKSGEMSIDGREA